MRFKLLRRHLLSSDSWSFVLPALGVLGRAHFPHVSELLGKEGTIPGSERGFMTLVLRLFSLEEISEFDLDL